jgi:TolB-like protein/Tfp pilus assembly protein PilF
MNNFFAELKRRNVIRVAIFYGAAAWLILQVADVLLDILGAPDGSLRILAAVLVLGLPFALILAWAFEVTPEGIKRESEVDRNLQAGDPAARKLDIATIALLLVAIALLIWSNFGARVAGPPPVAQQTASGVTPEQPRDLSIAVLPFVNMSPDPDNEYFSEGLSEEVLNVLARMQDFRVAGRTSSFSFKGRPEDLRAIGERLGVANILEGSVRKQGDQVRVTAQLIDARDGYHLWSETYDRRLDDVFAIQDEIATEVVKALRLTLLDADEAVISQTAKGDVEAYNHYLLGQSLVRLRTRDGLERALEEFQQAIVIDPEYAPPYAGIAMVYALLDNYSYRPLAETEALAHRALERALALDPQSDEAWAVRGLLLNQGKGAQQRLPEARAALERAVEINPNNAIAHLWRATMLYPDFEAVSASVRRAYELDPLSPIIIYRRAMIALQDQDEAAYERFASELMEVAPEWFITWQAAGSAAQQAGRIAEAALAFERAVELNPEYVGGLSALAFSLEMLGYEARAEALYTRAFQARASDELRINIAALRTRQALLGNDHAAAAQVYREAVEALDAPTPDRIAELAMLEIGAGQLDEAERRLRALLFEDGTGDGDAGDVGAQAPEMILAQLALATVLSQQGATAAAARHAEAAMDIARELEARGVQLNFLPLMAGVIEYLDGQRDTLEAGLEASIREGFRTPPASLVWMMPLAAGSAELDLVSRRMGEVLAEERARYDAAVAERVRP